MTPMLTVRACAAYLQVSPKTVYRAIWSGQLPAARVGGRLRIRAADVETYVGRCTGNTVEDGPDEG